MFKNEVKNELQTIFTSSKNIDNEIVNIKIAIHNLEKLGLDTKEPRVPLRVDERVHTRDCHRE